MNTFVRVLRYFTLLYDKMYTKMYTLFYTDTRTGDGPLYHPVRPPPVAPKALRKMRGAFFLLCRINFTEYHLSVKIDPYTLYFFCYLGDRVYEKSVKQGKVKKL